MGVFERIQGYSASGKKSTSSVFDITKPEGAFLQSVHNNGFNMYEETYELKDELRLSDDEYDNLLTEEQADYDSSVSINKEQYNQLSDQKKSDYVQNIHFTELHDVLTSCGNQTINAIAGSGKALRNGSGVLTPEGYKPIESLKIGDLVAAEDGHFYQVLGVFPQGMKSLYEVILSDGTVIECSGDHLWSIVKEEDIGIDVKTTTKLMLGDKLPSVSEIKFPDSIGVLPIRPYLLGVLLTSLCDINISHKPIMVHIKDSILTKVESILSDMNGVSLTYLRDDIYELKDEYGELEESLEDLGLFNGGFLFIPKIYLFAGVGERYDLLEGLLDSKGSYSEGEYKFLATMHSDTNVFLRDIKFLCGSLGCNVSYLKDSQNSVYGITITSRSGKRLHGDSDISWYQNGVSYLEVVGIIDKRCKEEMTCITIGSPNHIFITDNFVPTHNTTALTFKIIHDIVTGEAVTLKSIPNGTQVRMVNKMWVCTFLKSGAVGLEKTIPYWQRKLGYTDTSNQITFSTLDAEFKRCLTAMGVATPIGSSNVLYTCMKNAVDACHITRNGNNLNAEDYQIISGIITYYRGRLDDSKYRHPSCKDYSLTPSILDLLVHQFANNRNKEGIMDFEEIMELLYKYLYTEPNPAVQNFVANRYNYIYIDEFQDTSQMAYAILKFYGRGRLWLNSFGGDVKVVSEGGTVEDGLYTAEETLGKFVVVGDVSQCLVEGSKISNGVDNINVEELKVGSDIISCAGFGETCMDNVINISKRYINTKVYRVRTENHSIKGTADHRVFGFKDIRFDVNNVNICLVGDKKVLTTGCGFSKVYSSYEMALEDAREWISTERSGVVYETALFEPIELNNITRSEFINMANSHSVDGLDKSILKSCNLVPLMLAELSEGDELLIYENGQFTRERVVSVNSERYSGYVYDVSTERCHNYISDGIVNHNCIYSFRGSDSRILAERFDKDFRPVISTLSVNWRCPSNILNPVVPSIHVNADSKSQRITSSKEGGEFKAYCFTSYKTMLKQLKIDLMRDMNDGMNACILCRTNYDGMIPAFMLEADKHFNFSISSDKMTMDSPLPKSIIGMASLFVERGTPAVERALKQLVHRTMHWNIHELVQVLKTNNKSIWDLDIEDIRYSCDCLTPIVLAIRDIIFIDGKRDRSKDIAGLQFLYFHLIQHVYDGDSAYCESARAYIEALLYLIDSNNFETVHQFIDEVSYLNDRLSGRISLSNANIQIATVHEFKGKECDSVYVWNDSDGVFPSSKCDIYDEEQLNEERRVHYIACTRAKKREHIYCMQLKVGMFVKEMDLILENPVKIGVSLPKKNNIIEEGEVIDS